jgi:hypothetical protein
MGVSKTVAANVFRRIGRYRLGCLLLKDPRVPLANKFFAFVLAACATLLLIAVEAPVEGMVAMMLPMLGIFVDIAVDGIEVLLLPILLAILILPTLVPRGMVDALRRA